MSIEKLENMKYEELQSLAKKKGVSAGGKKEEIIARITALQEQREMTAELTQREEEPEPEAQEEEKAVAEKEVAEKKEEESEETEGRAAGIVAVEITEKYLDRQFNKIKEAGEILCVSKERAGELIAAKVAKIKE